MEVATIETHRSVDTELGESSAIPAAKTIGQIICGEQIITEITTENATAHTYGQDVEFNNVQIKLEENKRLMILADEAIVHTLVHKFGVEERQEPHLTKDDLLLYAASQQEFCEHGQLQAVLTEET